MQNLYKDALGHGIAFVPGEHFYATPGNGSATMRLNFTMVDEALIGRAVRTLAALINRSRPT